MTYFRYRKPQSKGLEARKVTYKSRHQMQFIRAQERGGELINIHTQILTKKIKADTPVIIHLLKELAKSARTLG